MKSKNISEAITEIDSNDDFLDDTIDINTIDSARDLDEEFYEDEEDLDDDDDESFNRRWYGE